MNIDIPDFDVQFDECNHIIILYFYSKSNELGEERNFNIKIMQLIVDNNILDRYINIIESSNILIQHIRFSIENFLMKLIYEQKLYKMVTNEWVFIENKWNSNLVE